MKLVPKTWDAMEGDTCVGVVIKIGNAYRASTPEGKNLGWFESKQEAKDAIKDE